MLIITQYPVADCRRFVADPRQLKLPYFVQPGEDEFVRHFGSVGHRRIRYAYCREEDHFCHADRALRITGPTKGMLRLTGCESRLYHDGHYRCKIETKFKYRFKPTTENHGNWLNELLAQHYGTPVRINTPRGSAISAPLFKAGPHLANLYLAASSFQTDEQEILQRQKRMHMRWISAAEPVSIIETCAGWSEMALTDCGAIRIDGAWEGVELYLFRYEETPCWILVRRQTSPQTLDLCRNIRTLLLYVHAERQSLLRTVQFIAAVSHSEEFLSRPALAHLRNTLDKLLSATRFGIAQTQIVDAVFHIDRKYALQEYRNLLRLFGQIDPKLLLQVDHQFIREDLDCLYSPIDFEKIIDRLTTNPAAENDPVCRQMVEYAQKRDRLGLKKLLRKFPSVSKQFVYHLIVECLKECMWKGITGGL